MQPQQWNKAVELFHAIREKGGAERSLLLESLCGDNRSLRIVVEQMLRNDESSNTFLAKPIAERLAETATRHDVAAGPSALFGRYEVVSSIGRGGMGEVWEARDTELARNVALKFLVPGTPDGCEELLTREARMASALNHPNIVTIYEVIRFEDIPIIAMELIEGESLRMLCGVPQPVERIANIGQQTARALAAAHKAGLIHRDIKPENILVRHDGYVKVVDFGLADQIAGESIGNGQLAGGTPRYMSPEQSRSEAISSATDIFSLGLVLYELATGRHAFPGTSPLQTIQAIRTDPPRPFPTAPAIPQQLQQLLVAMLAKDPSLRPSAEDVAEKLNHITSSLSLRGAVSRLIKSHRLVIGGGLMLVALLSVWLGTAGRDKKGVQDLKVHPLTSQPGWERAPAVSPDGKSVAYVWSEKLDGFGALYMQRLGEKEPVKLTDSGHGPMGYIAWSPDGRRIAFVRADHAADTIYSIDSSGGDEHKIVEFLKGNISSSLDWSPDGNYLAFSDKLLDGDRLATYTYNLRTGEKRMLTSPPAGIWGDFSPAFSPDGQTVAFKRVRDFWADEIYLVPASGGSARKLTDIRRGIWGFAWEPDGNGLIVSCQRNSSSFGIWRISLNNPNHPELIQQGGGDAVMPATSRRSGRMAWVNQLWDLNIYRVNTTNTSAPVRIIGSTLRDQDAVYASDGRIAWVSDRSGSREIWIARSDGTGQIQATNFNGPPTGHLQWSSDGRRLAFDSQPDGQPAIFLMECAVDALSCGKPTQLIAAGAAEAPSWSADDQFLYFVSPRTGQKEIWKMPVTGGEPMRVSHQGGYLSRESRDGRWLYFSRVNGNSIWRIPTPVYGKASAIEPEIIVGPPYRVQTEGWTTRSEDIVFIDQSRGGNPAAIRSYSPAIKRIRTIIPLTEVFLDRGDITVSSSHDGRWILYSQLDRSGSNVLVAENSR